VSVSSWPLCKALHNALNAIRSFAELCITAKNCRSANASGRLLNLDSSHSATAINRRPSAQSSYSKQSSCSTKRKIHDWNIALARFSMLTSAGSTASSFPIKPSSLNHFSLRLQPIVLIALCLIFRITSAAPEFSIQRLACLTGTGLAPVGIHYLA
jgi:hypothetical protein